MSSRERSERDAGHLTELTGPTTEQARGTFSVMVPLNIDENQVLLIHLTEIKVALTDFHFRVFVREDAFRSQTSDRDFKVGCKKAFSPTGEKEERAQKKTGWYLDSPKSEKERLAFFLFFGLHYRINLVRVQYFFVREHVSAC